MTPTASIQAHKKAVKMLLLTGRQPIIYKGCKRSFKAICLESGRAVFVRGVVGRSAFFEVEPFQSDDSRLFFNAYSDYIDTFIRNYKTKKLDMIFDIYD